MKGEKGGGRGKEVETEGEREGKGESIIPAVEQINLVGLDVGPRPLLLLHPNFRSSKHHLSVLHATYISRDTKQNKEGKPSCGFTWVALIRVKLRAGGNLY